VGLSDAEKKMLKKLQAKESEPDAPAVGRSLTAHIDLSDPKQIAMAIKHGFLSSDEDDDDDGDDDADDDEETPKRKGFFE
jgi:hypothetical protein